METGRQTAHLERLWAELRYTPCSPRCANWLRYGVQPRDARPNQHAGRCKAKVHQRTTLGMGGRRVLVSRQWSGKTLADHKADTRAWVKALLGITDDHAPAPDGEPGKPARSSGRWLAATTRTSRHSNTGSSARSLRASNSAQLRAAMDAVDHGPPDLSATDTTDSNGEEIGIG